MTSAWPGQVFGFKVTKEQTGSAGTLEHPVVIVHHTTETDSPVGSYPNPPHFEVSESKIRQFRSLDEWAAALRHSSSAPFSPNAHAVQIEIVARSKQKVYELPAGTLDRVAALDAYIYQYHGVPLTVPNGWPDDCADMQLPWAVDNSRRKWAAKANGSTHNFPAVRGIWEHKEVPWQDPSWHWDCGALSRTKIIARAEEFTKKEDAPKKQPEAPSWPGRYLKLAHPMMTGNDVRTWQKQLTESGWVIGVDGILGEETDGATRKLQRHSHLIVDGIVGPITWGAGWS